MPPAHAAPRSASRRDVFCYFDNDVKVHAPFDAMRLAGMASALEAPRQRRVAAAR